MELPPGLPRRERQGSERSVERGVPTRASGAASGPPKTGAAVWSGVKPQPPDLPSHDMTEAADGAAFGTP